MSQAGISREGCANCAEQSLSPKRFHILLRRSLGDEPLVMRFLANPGPR